MAGLYCLMGYPQAKLVDWMHRRFKVQPNDGGSRDIRRQRVGSAPRASPILAFDGVVKRYGTLGGAGRASASQVNRGESCA